MALSLATVQHHLDTPTWRRRGLEAAEALSLATVQHLDNTVPMQCRDQPLPGREDRPTPARPATGPRRRLRGPDPCASWFAGGDVHPPYDREVADVSVKISNF